jgi:hypothetical protein
MAPKRAGNNYAQVEPITIEPYVEFAQQGYIPVKRSCLIEETINVPVKPQ